MSSCAYTAAERAPFPSQEFVLARPASLALRTLFREPSYLVEHPVLCEQASGLFVDFLGVRQAFFVRVCEALDVRGLKADVFGDCLCRRRHSANVAR